MLKVYISKGWQKSPGRQGSLGIFLIHEEYEDDFILNFLFGKGTKIIFYPISYSRKRHG